MAYVHFAMALTITSQNERRESVVLCEAMQAAGNNCPSMEDTTLKLTESTALDGVAHSSWRSSENLVCVLQNAMSSGKAVQGVMDQSERHRQPGSRDDANVMISSSRLKRGNSGPMIQHQVNVVGDTADEDVLDSLEGESSGVRATAGRLSMSDSCSASGVPHAAGQKVECGNGAVSSSTSERLQKHLGSGVERAGEPAGAPSTLLAGDSSTAILSCTRTLTSSFSTAECTESSFATARESLTPKASNRNDREKGVGGTPAYDACPAMMLSAPGSAGRSKINNASGSRRRKSTGDVKFGSCAAAGSEGKIHAADPPRGRPRIGSAFPTTYNLRPSYIDGTAVGRRLTAQNNIWSGVGSYEPLRSSVFHGVFPKLSPELQALCMQCFGTPDSPELRALTDIQKAVMALVAKQSLTKSAEAKDRIVKELNDRGTPKGAVDKLEQFLLTRVPILIYFDIASLTPHLAQGGYFRYVPILAAALSDCDAPDARIQSLAYYGCPGAQPVSRVMSLTQLTL